MNAAIPRIVGRFPTPETLVELGPLVMARWSVPDAHAGALIAAGRPVPPAVVGAMLVDTGATSTCIDLEVAQQLGLKTIGYVNTYGAHGLQRNSLFEARCGVSVEFAPGVVQFFDSELQVSGIKDLKASGASRGLTRNGVPIPLIGLLGRDFLRLGTLIYDGIAGKLEIRLTAVASAFSNGHAQAQAQPASLPTPAPQPQKP